MKLRWCHCHDAVSLFIPIYFHPDDLIHFHCIKIQVKAFHGDPYNTVQIFISDFACCLSFLDAYTGPTQSAHVRESW